MTDGQERVDADGGQGRRVRSVDRALAIFELFEERRTPLGARFIAGAMAMPRSSTNVMLRSLRDGGYLRFDRREATYFPTLKVVRLGDWLFEGQGADAALQRLMTEIQRETRETVALSMRHGAKARMVAVVPSDLVLTLNLKPGDGTSVFHSAAGLAILAGHDDAVIRALVERHPRDGEAVRAADLLAEVARVRAAGFALAYDRWLPDVGAIAVPVPAGRLGAPAALAVGGPTFRIRRNEGELTRVLLEMTADLRGARAPAAPRPSDEEEVA